MGIPICRLGRDRSKRFFLFESYLLTARRSVAIQILNYFSFSCQPELLRQILLPLLGGSDRVNEVASPRRRLTRAANESHPSLSGNTTGLTVVARLAGADHIIPLMPATEMAGDHMVDGELSCLLATILAGMVVSKEYLSLGQFPQRLRALDQIDEANY